MQLICNELSFYPLAENGHVAEARFKQFFKTFNEAKDKYGFNHVRFPINNHIQQITGTETFFQWVSSLSNRTLKDLIVALCKPPFIDDLEEAELKTFFESNYKVGGKNIPTNIQPVGLPVSYIKSIPAISFDAHLFWRNRKIIIYKTSDNESENANFIAYNICVETDLVSKEFIEWADNSMAKLIDTEIILRKYLGFTKYQIVFGDNFMLQFFEWKNEHFENFKYLLLLMKDVQLHPFTGGLGQTENLRGRGKEASKRVTNPDRLSYTLEKNIVTFIACKGHYDFHN
jgi:Txe/YoeB family toxin of Txe-Axe toxin-antitoxin module